MGGSKINSLIYVENVQCSMFNKIIAKYYKQYYKYFITFNPSKLSSPHALSGDPIIRFAQMFNVECSIR